MISMKKNQSTPYYKLPSYRVLSTLVGGRYQPATDQNRPLLTSPDQVLYTLGVLGSNPT